MTPEVLYLQLGRLVAEMPDLGAQGTISSEANQWLGRAYALVQQAGDGMDQQLFKIVSQNLGGVTGRSNAQTIAAIVHRALAVAELAAPANLQGAFIPAGGHFDVFVAFGKVMGTAKRDVLIVDPYADETALTHFAIQAPAGVVVRLLADAADHKASLGPATQRWRAQYGQTRPLDVRFSRAKSLHDRLVIVDETAAWSFGQSLNAIATRAHTSIIRADPETGAMKVAAYAGIWASADPL